MERKKRTLKDDVGSNNESCECGSASTKGIWRILAYKNVRKFLKELLKKENGGIFASGLARKPPFFQSLSR